jgi:hypothetical protein
MKLYTLNKINPMVRMCIKMRTTLCMCIRILSAKYGKETKAIKNKEQIDRHYIPLEGMETRKEAMATRKRKPLRP